MEVTKPMCFVDQEHSHSKGIWEPLAQFIGCSICSRDWCLSCTHKDGAGVQLKLLCSLNFQWSRALPRPGSTISCGSLDQTVTLNSPSPASLFLPLWWEKMDLPHQPSFKNWNIPFGKCPGRSCCPSLSFMHLFFLARSWSGFVTFSSKYQVHS